MFNIVLYEPEIPPNTGNIMRLCRNMGATLHLVYPLGFSLEDKQLKRAGLDYRDKCVIKTHSCWREFVENYPSVRLFACSTKGHRCYADVCYKKQDTFVFGPETRGLPDILLDSFCAKRIIRIPMRVDSRSLNLSNAVAIILAEAWRQFDFMGGA